ncbi:MAG: response regulator [Deltaproteobacteria bacterium]|nr:response regulator [Deltaproteobacteria bacterium]
MADDLDMILVVDDDPTLRKALSRILRHHGHRVLEAADGPTALALSREYSLALLVLDYMMPGMDGGMVLRQLRRELRDDAPPTLLLTACESQAERAQDLGAACGVTKPFRVQQLLDAVDRHRRCVRRMSD